MDIKDEGDPFPVEVQTTDLVLPDPFEIPVSPDKVPLAPKAVMAFELRKAGADYDTIANRLGYKDGRSARAAILQRIKKYYAANQDAIEEIMALEMERLDHLQLVCWRLAKDGDLAAVDRILKIMERRAKLMGIDQQTDSGGGVDNSVNQTAIFIGGSEDDYIHALKKATGAISEIPNNKASE